MLDHNTQQYIGYLWKIDSRKKAFSFLPLQGNRKGGKGCRTVAKAHRKLFLTWSWKKSYRKSCPLQIRHSAGADNILRKFWSLKMPHKITRHFKTRSMPITPHLAIIQMSALYLTGPMPQFRAISIGATRSTNYFQRLLNKGQWTKFNSIQYLSPPGPNLPFQSYTLWVLFVMALCGFCDFAHVVPKILFCFPMFRFCLFLRCNEAFSATPAVTFWQLMWCVEAFEML